MTDKNYDPASNEDLRHEARNWDSGIKDPTEWHDAPDAIPRLGTSTLISLRVPTQMLEILKAFAQREGVGYQVLIKRWLDERIREEHERLVSRQMIKLHHPTVVSVAAAFSPVDEQILKENR
jgi:hypothetical protein